MKNRIWIELDKTDTKEQAEAQCKLANSMLSKLGDMGGQEFFWMVGEGYCYGGDMGYENLPDRGKWFNLDYLGREV